MTGCLNKHIWNIKNSMGGFPLDINKALFTPIGLSTNLIKPSQYCNDNVNDNPIIFKEIIHQEYQEGILEPIEHMYIHKKTNKAKKSRTSVSSKKGKKSKAYTKKKIMN